MLDDRVTARLVGLLFIIASAAAIVGGSLLLPLDEPTFLADVPAHDSQVVTGALFELVIVAAVVGIAAMLFPILRRRNEGLALGYLGARILEGGLLLAASLSALLVLVFAQDYGTAQGAQPIGDVLIDAREWTTLIGSLLVFGLGALILYSMLFRAGLVPQWLSVWGIVGAVLILARALLEVYGAELSGAVQVLLAAPIALNEMVLALWLIIKGFAGESEPAVPERVPSAVGV